LPPLPEATVVSAGLAFLGVAPEARIDGAWPLLPALSWESAITELRPMETGVVVGPTRRDLLDRTSILAAVPVGTADGLPSVLGGRAEACVRGRRAPVLGGVGADSILLDVTEVPQVREGDRVVLLGRQGKEEVPALELSALSGRTVRELLEGISPRVPRQYRDLHGPIDLPLPEE
jgi:alanine racemase